ncbi:hypothetical protein F4775DRAFT_414729 [Biscogniauxia sp. FL1348]|nr:hypothetical protein F4775DRAFT_414729 [Biscogniauxia sp. FL1348]
MMVRLEARPLSPEPWPLHVHLIDDNTQLDGKAYHFQTSTGPYPDITHHPPSSAQASTPKACRCSSPAPSPFGATTSTGLSSSKPSRRKSKPDAPAATPPLPPCPCPCPAHPSPPFLSPTSPPPPPPLPPPTPLFPFPPSRRPTPKRARPAHDVDGPETHTLAIKKRRLRLALVTSRLSRPFSAPATHICLRERGTHANARFRLLLLYVARRSGAAAGGGGGGYVRKAAILNRAMGVRRAAEASMGSAGGVVGRGGVVEDYYGGFGFGFGYGVQMGTGPRVRERDDAGRREGIGIGIRRADCSALLAKTVTAPRVVEQPPLAYRAPPPPPLSQGVDITAADEDAEISFPGSAMRYADLSDEDDMGDDVYADFGVLFGPGAGEGGGGGKADCEGYLDELDGMRWGA